MKLLTTSLVMVALLGACTQGEDPSDLYNANNATPGGAAGGFGENGVFLDANGNPIATSSLDFFEQAIGDRVFFPVDQSTLTPEATAVLSKQAEYSGA